MSKPNSIFAAIIVGLLCGLLAFGGQPGLVGLAKSVIVFAFSGSIVLILGLELEQIGTASEVASQLATDFDKRVLDIPSLHEFEVVAKRRGSIVSAEKIAEKFVVQHSQSLEFARTYAKLSIYMGVGGTLAAIAIGSIGIKSLKGDLNQIIAIASWSGGSLLCAVCGIVAAAILTLRLDRFDSQMGALERLAESHVSEVVLQESVSNEDRLSHIIAKTVSECFVQVSDIWESFRLTAKKIEHGGSALEQAAAQVHNAGERLAEQTEVSNRITWQLNSTSENITETARTCAESGRLLQDISTQLVPLFRTIQAGVENLDKSVGTLYPALDSARDLQLTIKAADLVFKNIDSQVSGMAGSLHDEIRNATDKMVSHQQNAFAEGIGPPLKSIARTMDLLLLLIDRTEQLLRNLPLAAPAKRIVDDLEAAGVAHLAGAERDAKTVAEVSRRLESTEARMEEVLRELRSAHTQIADSLKEIETETADLARNVGEVSSHIDGPFWKKLGGRKP